MLYADGGMGGRRGKGGGKKIHQTSVAYGSNRAGVARKGARRLKGGGESDLEGNVSAKGTGSKPVATIPREYSIAHTRVTDAPWEVFPYSKGEKGEGKRR